MKQPFNRPLKRTFADSLRHAIGKAIAWFYRMAFGGFEEPLYRKNRKRFIREIELDFAYLLSEYKGHIVPDGGEELPRAFDYVAAVIEFEEIRVRLVRGRGELEAQVASIRDPYSWRELSLIWQSIDPLHPIPSIFGAHELTRIALRIQERFIQITEVVRDF